MSLSAFFDSLLHETEELQQESARKNRVSIVKLEPKLPTIPLPTPIPVVIEAAPKIENKQQQEPGNIIESDSIKVNNRTESFQILLFNTAGLNLAVPLIELSGVLEWPDKITQMPGHADFYLGLVQHLGKQIPIIDLAEIIFPADKLANLATEKRLQSIRKIVLIDNAKWGLACDDVQQIITIEPEQVRWRVKRHTRRWLAGTVIDHMCALLDSTQLAGLLQDGYEH